MPRSEGRPLTDAVVKALKPGTSRKDRRDGLQHGLVLSVLPSGRKQWCVRYRLAGRQARLVLGVYSTKPGGMTLSIARQRCAA